MPLYVVIMALNTLAMNWLSGLLNNELHCCIFSQASQTRIAYIERFNRTARHKWLDLHALETIEHAQLLATQWLWTYYIERPHTAIGGIPPRQLLKVA